MNKKVYQNELYYKICHYYRKPEIEIKRGFNIPKLLQEDVIAKGGKCTKESVRNWLTLRMRPSRKQSAILYPLLESMGISNPDKYFLN